MGLTAFQTANGAKRCAEAAAGRGARVGNAGMASSASTAACPANAGATVSVSREADERAVGAYLAYSHLRDALSPVVRAGGQSWRGYARILVVKAATPTLFRAALQFVVVGTPGKLCVVDEAEGTVTVERARVFVVWWSLGLVGFAGVFFALAPLVPSFPMDYPEALRVEKAIAPVFTGYIGTAAYSIFKDEESASVSSQASISRLAGLLLRAPLVIATVVLVAFLAAFWLSNRPDATTEPMTLESLETAIAAVLGLLTISTSLGVSFLFSRERKPDPAGPPPPLPTRPEPRVRGY